MVYLLKKKKKNNLINHYWSNIPIFKIFYLLRSTLLCSVDTVRIGGRQENSARNMMSTYHERKIHHMTPTPMFVVYNPCASILKFKYEHIHWPYKEFSSCLYPVISISCTWLVIAKIGPQIYTASLGQSSTNVYPCPFNNKV